jgi:hypothetical protein
VVDDFDRPPLDVAGQRFDEVRAAQRIDRARDPGLLGDDLLGTQRYLRGVLSAERRKLIELQPSSKVLYFAGVQFGANLILPWIAAAVEALRAAGFSRQDATLLVQALGSRALRGYGKGGRRAWNAAKTAELHRAIHRELPALRAQESDLAKLYESGIARARAFFESESLQP